VLGVRQLDEYQFPQVDRVARELRGLLSLVVSGQLSRIAGK
jgi:hypothetical protein